MKYTKDIIAILVVLLAGLSLFITPVNQTIVEFVRFAAGLVIGNYFGAGQVSKIISKVFKKKVIKK